MASVDLENKVREITTERYLKGRGNLPDLGAEDFQELFAMTMMEWVRRGGEAPDTRVYLTISAFVDKDGHPSMGEWTSEFRRDF